MIKKVIILHEYGAPRHFKALYYLEEIREIKEIESIEFNIFKQFAKGIFYRDIKWIKKSFKSIKKIIRLLKGKRQIIIIGSAPYDPIIPLLLYLKKRNRVIYFTSWPYWQGERHPHKAFYPYQKKLWNKFINGITAVTISEAAQDAISKLGAKPVHIPHSVNTEMFKVRKSKIDTSKIKILFVGQIAWHKGVDLLMDIVRDELWKNIECWFVGRGVLSKELRRLANKGYPVKCFGYVSDECRLAEIYGSADIFVLPSRQRENWEELFGIALIEAMASGLPVVASDCVGPREIIDNDYNGYLFSKNNKKELIKILNILINDPILRIRLGENGLSKVKKTYEVKVVAQKWKKILELF